ncbi:YcnI family protein [Streptomyces sp. NBC_01387]|uniref:YcnI family copper-binding membrane protein n=1 Tax=unclassified Streptomyces TaxID=2593676 RepID=UPI00202575F9|nr:MULTISPECIES: YcnI family protein [unclassified Streptomyces]MCX4549475.1 YcnI family protein [Streptomyces sp. NBC_01500]WSC21012.1 YcnI family protein [Streptomyces sp. NBC_01766]WSV54998.1 YcnI family protein [Streptomyces sp. NBC_01014]
MSVNTRRIAVIGGIAATSVLLVSGTAFAHVTVQPQGEAAKGGYATIAFKVPNERDNAATTKLEVNFPTDHPLASVMPEPVPGWQVKVTTSKLAKPVTLHGKQIDEAVSKVTWTGGKIEPGQFQQFPLSVGQLPTDTDQLAFKALQTYSDKEVVRWIEEQKPGAEEPQNPAPVLTLSAADTAGATPDSASGKTSDSGNGTATRATASSSDSSDNTARILGVIGIVIGIAGIAFGVLAGRRRTH